MRPTPSFLYRQFNYWNNLIFDNELPIPTLSITTAARYAGVFKVHRRKSFGGVVESYSISLSALFDHSEDELNDTIIHEMVHFYIHIKKYQDTSSHGVIFRELIRKINERFGRHVKVSESFTNDVAASSLRSAIFVLAVSEMTDGKRLVTVISPRYRIVLPPLIAKIPGVKRTNVYLSSDNRLLRYPKVRTPKLYAMEPELLDEILASSCQLKTRP